MALEIIDIYFPKSSIHPTLRIIKSDDKFEITKKELINGNSPHKEEQTIILSEKEFNELKKVDGKILHKTRYYYNHKNKIAEIGIFQGNLKGLVLVDFEFETNEQKNSFKIPYFCLVEVTNEEFLAGGMLCGKSYEEIEEKLKKFNYKKIE